MGLYVQQGYGKGSRIDKLLTDSAIEGWVLSPFDESPGNLSETARRVRETGLALLLDPQSFVHSISGARVGHRDEHGLAMQNFGIGMTAADVAAHVSATAEVNRILQTSDSIAPAAIQRGFRDPWATLSIQFATGTGHGMASLVVAEAALDDSAAMQWWLNQITSPSRISGVYIVVSREIGGSYPYVWSELRLANLLRLIYWLRKNDMTVVIGYQDAEGLACLAAGATAIVSGWSVNRRVFVESRWRPQGGGGAPLTRVWVPDLLAPLRIQEAAAIASRPELRRLLSPGSLARIIGASQLSQTQSQIDYLSDLAEIARECQQDGASLRPRLERARELLRAVRVQVPTIEPVHLARITATINAMQQFDRNSG